jgi:hypothetical protein
MEEMDPMALRTKLQNQKFAERINATLGLQTTALCANNKVSNVFVAAVISVKDPSGVTFDPNYAPNALGVMRELELLEG